MNTSTTFSFFFFIYFIFYFYFFFIFQVQALDRCIRGESDPEETVADSCRLPGLRVLPVYRPGDAIRGNVILTLSNPIKADSLSINFLGECVLSIRAYNKFGQHDETERETYLHKSLSLWQKSKQADQSEDSAALLVSGSTDDVALTPGTHTFPFDFALPDGAPQSMCNLCPSEKCYAVYRLKAKLVSGKSLAKRKVVTHKGIWVEKPFNIAANPDDLVPVVVEETIDTGLLFKSAKINIKCTVPRKAFVKGEAIPLKLEIDNQSTLKIDKVVAFLHLTGHFKLDSAARKDIDVRGKKTTCLDVAPGQMTTLDLQLPWKFAAGSLDVNLLPTGCLDGWKRVSLQYNITVKAKRNGMHRNLLLNIPLTIGNISK
jgi:hypothetical protein